jgi:hypothetical protein
VYDAGREVTRVSDIGREVTCVYDVECDWT